jgi:hypothetical protein
MAPPVFVSYRRVDEPFAAALVFAVVADRWNGDPVFLDTRFLEQRGNVGRQLLAAVANSQLVLAIIGRVWDDPKRRERLADRSDWVRQELIAATRAGTPVVPVLVDREDIPAELPFEPVPEWCSPLHLDSSDFWRSVEVVIGQAATILGPPTASQPARTPGELIHLAVDAMLRHVLPLPQRRMRNDEMITEVVARELRDRDWLRFVATANLLGRPNGSGIVWSTLDYLGVADLGTDFRPRTTPLHVCLAGLRLVDRLDCRRLWKPVSDLRFVQDDGAQLDLRGFFADEADELLTVLELP